MEFLVWPSILKDALVLNSWIVVPQFTQKQVLQRTMHMGHQSNLTKIILKAKESVFMPDISKLMTLGIVVLGEGLCFM